ncbi:unnamed protein product [marine sediment metagenome]|uniref:Uncharacterized protein n=1 Tax=marine sediment metagenome TaxID=412755 RepID=X0Z2R4_9ZZZZ
MTKGTITYPLKYASLLREIKAGELDYTAKVAPLLEEMMDEVETLSKESDLPEKVDREFWDQFIMKEVGGYIDGKISHYDLL